MAVTFPDEFSRIYDRSYKDVVEFCDSERALLGWDHAKMGAFYLWNHHIAREIVETTSAWKLFATCIGAHTATSPTRRRYHTGLAGREEPWRTPSRLDRPRKAQARERCDVKLQAVEHVCRLREGHCAAVQRELLECAGRGVDRAGGGQVQHRDLGPAPEVLPEGAGDARVAPKVEVRD